MQASMIQILFGQFPMERFHSRDNIVLLKTKSNVCIIIELHFRMTALVPQNGRRLFVLKHQHGRLDVT